jgi:lysophospholipase L1-like esterase
VATALAQRDGALHFANLAVRGRLLDQVVDEQLPVALGFAPDLLSFHAGPNDVLRPQVDVVSVLRRYDDAVRRIRTASADTTVVLFTAVEGTGGTGRTARWLASRFASFNAGIRRAARRHGCVLVDVGAVPALRDRRMFDRDRLHLNVEGHARIAAAALEALGVDDPALLGGAPGWWREPLGPGARARKHIALAADVRWFGRHLVPWVARRVRGTSSGDRVSAKHTELVELRALPR